MAPSTNAVWDAENADHRRAFATALAPLVAVLWKRKEPFGRVEAMTYMRTLKAVPAPILVEAVEQALQADHWFPEPSKLLTYAAAVLDVRRAEARDRWLLSDCVECGGSRWSEIVVAGVTRMTRCGCWTRAMTAMADVGEPLARPLLLASREEATE